jgi:hypothetical protein
MTIIILHYGVQNIKAGTMEEGIREMLIGVHLLSVSACRRLLLSFLLPRSAGERGPTLPVKKPASPSRFKSKHAVFNQIKLTF